MVQVSYSTSGFKDHQLAPALDAIAEAGFRCIEYSIDSHASEDRPGRFAAEANRELERRGLSATTVHGPARTNVLGAPTEEWRKEKVGVLADALRFCGQIGAAGMVIHGIPNPMFLPKDQEKRSLYEPMVAAMKKSVEDLIPVAAETGVRLLLENLPYNCELEQFDGVGSIGGGGGDYPLMKIVELRAFIEEFPPDQVGLVVDTGHAWTEGTDPVSEIMAAGDRLWATHLQDVDAEAPADNHWVPTHGGLKWDQILAALKSINYRGAYTFEVINAHHGESPEQLAQLTYGVAKEWGLPD
jgi:sugar phosphate isomerase/epimerase